MGNIKGGREGRRIGVINADNDYSSLFRLIMSEEIMMEGGRAKGRGVDKDEYETK